MDDQDASPPSAHICGVDEAAKGLFGQIVLVLQGGGALGAFQGGVYEALHEAGLEPDWVIGTSIGAINGALIMGNPRALRLARLREFWRRMENGPRLPLPGLFAPLFANAEASNLFLTGLPNFFAPNFSALMAPFLPAGAANAGYYNTDGLHRTLEELVEIKDFCDPASRLTVGAACVSNARMKYFDSRDERIGLDHVRASGALPPAFAPVKIDDEFYWDGGILSNTPIEAVFDDDDRRSGLVFATNVWQSHGDAPASMNEVAARQKDVTYANKMEAQVARQQQIHRLRHVISSLAQRLPAGKKPDAELLGLMEYGCMTRMHVMNLDLPPMAGETALKDVDFSPNSLRARWREGYDCARKVVEAAPWTRPGDPLDGLVLHEARA